MEIAMEEQGERQMDKTADRRGAAVDHQEAWEGELPAQKAALWPWALQCLPLPREQKQ